MNQQVALKSNALGSNPKDLLGAAKISLSKLPAVAVLHGAHAMMNGADKYGPYNWRDKKVIASIYIDAMRRHIDAWEEREEYALDSLVHHLGHAIACAGILLDAQITGNLIDDRPSSLTPGFYTRELDKLNARVKEVRERMGTIKKLSNPKHFPHPHKLVEYRNGNSSSSSQKTSSRRVKKVRSLR